MVLGALLPEGAERRDKHDHDWDQVGDPRVPVANVRERCLEAHGRYGRTPAASTASVRSAAVRMRRRRGVIQSGRLDTTQARIPPAAPTDVAA
jgi:hypothetical protein